MTFVALEDHVRTGLQPGDRRCRVAFFAGLRGRVRAGRRSVRFVMDESTATALKHAVSQTYTKELDVMFDNIGAN